MACPNCGAPGGGASGCGSCGLGRDPNVGTHINAGQTEMNIQADRNRRAEQQRNQSTASRNSQSHRSGNSGGSADCFSGDTLILTPSGYKRMDEVNINDVVLGMDRNNQIVRNRVKRTIHHKKMGRILTVTLSSGDVVRTTKGHPIYTQNGWVKAKNLSIKDLLCNVDINGEVSWNSVEKVNPSETVEPVFNLVVNGTNTYVVKGCFAHSFVKLRVLRSILSKIWAFCSASKTLKESSLVTQLS